MKRPIAFVVVGGLMVSVMACGPSPAEPTRTATATTAATTTAVPTPAQTTQPAPTTPARTYALPGDRVFPEGIAYDPATNSFFTGSTNDGTVFRGDLATGNVSVFLPGGTDGRTAAIGMKVDSKNRRLWIAGGATGLIFAYNVDTAELIRKYTTPAAEQTFLNDVTVAANGDAYFTDSRRPMLFKISGSSAEPGELEGWLDLAGTPVRFPTGSTALNGIVITPVGAYLLVVHSSDQKLYRISVGSKTIREIDLGGAPQGGDGMVLDGNMLYVLERTQDSDRIVRIQMTPDFSRGTVKDTFRDDSFAFPTTIAKLDGRMLVVNSQFNARSAGQTPKLPFTVSDIPIPPPAP